MQLLWIDKPNAEEGEAVSQTTYALPLHEPEFSICRSIGEDGIEYFEVLSPGHGSASGYDFLGEFYTLEAAKQHAQVLAKVRVNEKAIEDGESVPFGFTSPHDDAFWVADPFMDEYGKPVDPVAYYGDAYLQSGFLNEGVEAQ